MEKLTTSPGSVDGPPALVQMVKDSPKPPPLGESGEDWPAVGGMPNYRAPLVYVDPDGATWFLGVRPLSMCTFSKCHRRNGWASVRTKRRRFWEGEIIHVGERIRVWICDESVRTGGGVFRLPFPLETFEDACTWRNAGIDLSMTETQWLKKLQWSGEGVRDAVQAVRERMRRLGSRGFAPLPWPDKLVGRIITPEAVETLARTMSWVDVAARIDALEAEVAGLRDELAGVSRKVDGLAALV